MSRSREISCCGKIKSNNVLTTEEVQYWLTLFLLRCLCLLFTFIFHFVFLKVERFKIKTWNLKEEGWRIKRERRGNFFKIWWCWIRIHDCFCDPVLDVKRVGESMKNLFLENVSFVRFFMHENYHDNVWPVNESFAST